MSDSMKQNVCLFVLAALVISLVPLKVYPDDKRCRLLVKGIAERELEMRRPIEDRSGISSLMLLASALLAVPFGGGCGISPAPAPDPRARSITPVEQEEINRFTEDYARWLKQSDFMTYAANYLIQGNDDSRSPESQYKALYTESEFQTDPSGSRLTLRLGGGCFSGNNDMYYNGFYTRQIIFAYLASGDERLKKAATLLLKGMSGYNKVTAHPDLMARIIVPDSYTSKSDKGDIAYDYDSKVRGCAADGLRADFPYTYVNDNPYFGGVYFQKGRSVDDFPGYFNAYYAARKVQETLTDKNDPLRQAADEFVGYARTFSDGVIANKMSDAPVCAYPIADIDYGINYFDPQYGTRVPTVSYNDPAPLVYYAVNDEPGAPMPLEEALDNKHGFVKVPPVIFLYNDSTDLIYYGSLWNLYAAAPSFDAPGNFASYWPPPAWDLKDVQYYMAAQGVASTEGNPEDANKFAGAIRDSLNIITDSYNGGLGPQPVRYAMNLIFAAGQGVPIASDESRSAMQIFRTYMDRWSKKFGGGPMDPWSVKDGESHLLNLEAEGSESEYEAAYMLAPLASCADGLGGSNGIVNCAYLLQLLQFK